jgi:hypothetical protein
MGTEDLALSPTVQRVRRKLVERTSVYAIEVVQSILDQHVELFI